jgi:hypothetical protein
MDSFRDLINRGFEEMIANSEEVFANSLMAPDSQAALGSADVVVSDEIVPVSADVMPVSEEVASEELFAGLEEVFVNSLVPPDSADVLVSNEVMPFCANVIADSIALHAGGIFGDACFQARRNARRCARCGLLHEDYDISAKWLHLMDRFDCEFYIPDVAKLEMDGTRIMLTDEVLKKVDEHIKKQQTKITKVQYMHLTIWPLQT